jgi:hypothetical protein
MKRLLTSVLILTALTVSALAADKPNFSGDWKLNIEKSNMGPLPPPTTYTRKVTQGADSVTIEDTQTGTALGDQHDTRTYKTDGTEITYQVNGADVKGALTWDGDAIVINSKASIQGMEFTIKDRVTLGEGGKTLTDTVHISTGQGDIDLTMLFEKQ